MALFTLETLVLSSFSTLCGGRKVELCLGASAEGYPTPENVISMRPSVNQVFASQGPAPRQKPAVADLQVDVRVGGAGRSLSAGWSRTFAAAPAAARPAVNALAALNPGSNPRTGLQPVTRTMGTSGTR